MKNKSRLDIGTNTGDRENGRSSRKPRGMKEREKSETLQVLWCDCKVENMGATPQDEAGGVGSGHTVYQLMEDGVP